MKKYKINKNQYNYLENKIINERIYSDIVSEIYNYNLFLNENVNLNEAIVDVLKKYAKRGLLTAGVISALLTNNVATAQNLIDAGISSDKIQFDDNLKKIEYEFINVLNKRKDSRNLERYNSLSQDEKDKILSIISDKIDDVNDISKFKYNVFVDSKRKLSSNRTTEISQEKVVTVDSIQVQLITSNFANFFKNNSDSINNEQELKSQLQQLFNGFYEINNITINSSSNTLRNTGDFEGMTWLDGSTSRANKIKSIVENMEYSLGGCNIPKQLSSNNIRINPRGDNGDGTSGPKSPFEVDKKYIDSYNQRGIGEQFWKSNAKDKPLSDIKQYEQFNKVEIVVDGIVIDLNEKGVTSYNYFQMFKPTKDKIKISIQTFKRANIKTPQKRVGAVPCSN